MAGNTFRTKKDSTLRALGPSERYLSSCHIHGDLQVGLAIVIKADTSAVSRNLPKALEALQDRLPQLRAKIVTREGPPSPGWIPNPWHWVKTPPPVRMMELHDVSTGADWRVHWKGGDCDIGASLTEAMRTPLDAEEGPMWQVMWEPHDQKGKQCGTLSVAFHPVIADVFGALLIATELITLLNSLLTDPNTLPGPPLGPTAPSPALESILPITDFILSMANLKAMASRLWGILWAPQPLWAKTFPPPAFPLTSASRVILLSLDHGQEPGQDLGRRLGEIMRTRRMGARALVTAAGLVAARRVLFSTENNKDPLERQGSVSLNTSQQVDLRPFCSRGGNVKTFNLHGWLSTFLQVSLEVPYISPSDPASFWTLCEDVDRRLVVLRDPSLPIRALHVGSWLRGDPDETVTQPPCSSGRLIADFGVVVADCPLAYMPKAGDGDGAVQVELAWACTSAPHMGAPITYQAVTCGGDGVVKFALVYHSGYVDAELAEKCRKEFVGALYTAAMPLITDDHVAGDVGQRDGEE